MSNPNTIFGAITYNYVKLMKNLIIFEGSEQILNNGNNCSQ